MTRNPAWNSDLATARANLNLGTAMTPSRLIPPAIYVALVVAANVMTEHYGLVSIGLGLMATAGTFAAGLVLAARNVSQDSIGRLPVVGLMLAGAVLSWCLASPQLAVASAVAFGLSEAADMGIYTPLRDKGRSRAALAATSVGAVVDTFVFLHLAGFPITTESVTGQLVVKVGVCVVAIAALAGVRRLGGESDPVLRESVDPAGA